MASIDFGGKNNRLYIANNPGWPLLRPETPPGPLSTIPFPRDPDFVSRDILLHRIHEKSSVPGSRIALVGLGGVGKSHLAIEYGYRVRFESPATWVFWVHADNEARFEQGFRDIANQVKIPGRQDPKVNRFALVENWLRDDNRGKWLLILDNFDDDQLLYQDPINSRTDALTKPLWEYVPKSRNGSVIITSRTKEVTLKIVDHKDLIELVNALEFMPLAIVQAASYIRNRAPRCSVSKYLKDFQGSDRKATALLIQEAYHSSRDWEAKNSILLTWQLSFDYIRQTKPSAAGLLSLMSFFDRQGIPESLIRHRPKAAYISDPELSDDPSDGEISEYGADLEFEDNIRMLRNYSFISISKNGTSFRMSRLVQLSTHAWLKSHGEIDQWRERFIRNLYQEFPIGRYENWGKCRSLFPHVRLAMSQRPKSPDSLLKWATLLYRGAWYASQSGSVTETREMAVKSRDQRVTLLGEEHKEALDSIAMLAIAYRLDGQWDEAEQLEVQVLETRKMTLGADHPDTLTSMANLASTYRNQGRWNEAEQLEVQVLETRKMTLGAGHPDTLTSMANLASTYRNQGRWNEAEQLEVQVLETRKMTLGAGHPDTLTSMANLASTYRNQGRWNEAEQLEVQVLETRKMTLGAGHPDTLTSMANLASTYRNQGRWNEAEQLEVQVLETRKMNLGVDHPDTLTSVANLASTYRNQGRWEEAERLEVQVLETRKIKLGADHPDTLTSVANLASTYLNQGRWEEAQQLEVQVLETRKMKLGADHPDTLTSVANLASTYRNQGRWEEAERLEVQVLETRKMKLGADHPDTLTSMANLASTYRNQGRWNEAEQLEVQVLETRRQTPGLEDLHTLDFSSEAPIHNRYVGLVDSDSSIENDSVFSAPFSIPSTRSLESARGEMNSLLIQEFANLLIEDGAMFSLLLIGVSKDSVGFERMRNNFRRLLKHFANNLKAEILNGSHQDLRRFISSYSAMITREVFAMVPIDERPNIKPHDLETENRITSVEKRLADESKVESYLQSLHRSGAAPQTSELIQVLDPDDEESDQDSVAEEAGEDDPYEGNLQNLHQMKHFILESTAYQILHRRLGDFVEPSLNSRFRDLVIRWSNPEHKNHADAVRYKLRNLATELQHVSPFGIQFERDEISSPFFRFMSHCQHLIERWTGEHWDWWPLPRCLRPLAESETRLRWECIQT
ncbi:uncharacterized protein N7483_002383 [Penicillium malachiteum]|uniref:uncharacterized protein n=1 Tax=Penicillium malachiteum TaxID=1324776 RepID=UPI0025470564|nr:uncharacterized protein N7483_002383 [Penicillium malachiteum]KAJ5737258.1 hypothetical protein N7483_002383 [Penicillium malachiteum]